MRQAKGARQEKATKRKAPKEKASKCASLSAQQSCVCLPERQSTGGKDHEKGKGGKAGFSRVQAKRQELQPINCSLLQALETGKGKKAVCLAGSIS